METLAALTTLSGQAVRASMTVGILLIVFLSISLVVSVVQRSVSQRTDDEEQRNRIRTLGRVARYGSAVALAIVGGFSYAGSWTGLGVSVGLLSAALGFALQKPVTSVAAWIMLVTKRPFKLGDRIIVNGLRGDVADITLTHTFLEEVGRFTGEDRSGRTIMIPNIMFFDHAVTNYSKRNEAILGEAVVEVTYESDVDAATALFTQLAEEATAHFKKQVAKPHTRIKLNASGIEVRVRFSAPFKEAAQVTSNLYREIHHAVKAHKRIDIAYPTTRVLLDK